MRKILALAAALSICAGASQAAVLQTTLTPGAGAAPAIDNIDRVVIKFSTDVVAGIVTQADLNDYSVSLFSGATLLYQDRVVVDGVGRPVGGGARDASSVYFRFDIDTLTLNEFNEGNLSNAVSGLVYGVGDNVSLPIDGELGIARFVNGAFEAFSLTGPWLQSTSEVPLPPAAFLFLAPVAAYAARRRKSR